MPLHKTDQYFQDFYEILAALDRQQLFAEQVLAKALNRPDVANKLGLPANADVVAAIPELSPQRLDRASRRVAATAGREAVELREAWSPIGGEPPNFDGLNELAERATSEHTAVVRIGQKLSAFALHYCVAVRPDWPTQALDELREIRDKELARLVDENVCPIGRPMSPDFAEAFQHMFTSTRQAIEGIQNGTDQRPQVDVLVEQAALMVGEGSFMADEILTYSRRFLTATSDQERIARTSAWAKLTGTRARVLNEAFETFWSSEEAVEARRVFGPEESSAELTERVIATASGSAQRRIGEAAKEAANAATQRFEEGAPRSRASSLSLG